MANLGSSTNLTFSYNEVTDSIVSFHSWKSVINFADSFNFVGTGTSTNTIWLQNKGEAGHFFGTRHDSYIVPILNDKPEINKNFYAFEYKLEMKDSDGESAEDLNFTKYQAYNEYQTTGDIVLATDDRRTDKHLRKWRTQFARDQNSRQQLQRLSNEYVFLKLLFNNSPVNGVYYQFSLYPIIYSYSPTIY